MMDGLRVVTGSLARIVLIILSMSRIEGSGSDSLSPFVSHYSPLDYSTYDIEESHNIHKRSVVRGEDGHQVYVDFTALDRRFHLALTKDHSVFHPEYEVLGPLDDHIHHTIDHTHYHGVVVGEPDSVVYGSLRGGVFDGTIVTQSDGTFYVERAGRYSDSLSNSSHHSVIYHDDHVSLPQGKDWLIGAANPGCGATADIQTWMSDIQISSNSEIDLTNSDINNNIDSENSGAESTGDLNSDNSGDESTVDLNSDDSGEESTGNPNYDPYPEYKYSKEANRVKRALPSPNNRKSCSLFIQTDPLLWRHVRAQEKSDAKTQEEILSMIAQHVKAVNRIYGDTEFSAGRYRHTGHTFQVNRIKIMNDSSCHHENGKKNPFCLSNIDVSNFLNLHSKTNHEHFCLAYVLTYRDFTGGTLGLAWVASASGASGGICEKYKTYTENVNGIHHTAQRSLNTGIITFVNYNSRVPPKVSQLTLAHEIGHNFGSPHDYPAECRPGGSRGNFIMFASATSGDRDNNNKFSPCSVKNISAVLDAVVDERKTNCLEDSNGAFCGNKIVEEGEECDCGFNEEECAEQCCYPRTFESKGKTNKLNSQSCKLKKDADCSPSKGPCCDDTCRFIKSSNRQLCKPEQDCTKRAYCNGDSALCPKADNMPDNVTECNEGTQVCQEGDCRGSICLKYGLEQCFLSSADTTVRHSTRDLCELACQERDSNQTCRSTGDWVKSGTKSHVGLIERLSLRPGAPCDNFQGYCDVFLKCRQVDAEGPLVRLKNLLLNQKTLLSIAQWVTTYWYAVLLLGIAFVVFMALFIKCFAAHTPSSNPKLPKNKHIGETLRRPMHTLRRKRYQQAPGTAGSTSSSAPPSRGAPPPYPGAPSGGPGHGYGEGRGHYNRSRGGGTPGSGDASRGGSGSGGRSAGSSQGGDRRSWAPQNGPNGPQRHSRIEMSPINNR